mgnify:CR=1 FL=1
MVPGPMQLMIILVICLILFGGKKLRSLGGDLGGAISEFKNSMTEEEEAEKNKDEATSAATSENTEESKG